MKLGGPEFPVEYPARRLADAGNAGASRSGFLRPAFSKGAVPSAEVPPPDKVQIAVPGLKELALSLALPQDKLSSFLLSFSKFFSLPLDTKLIHRLRQEAVSLKPGSEDALRSGAFATTAAAGKGLVLSTEALTKYAAAIAGDERNSGDTGGDRDGGATDQDGGAATGGNGNPQEGTGEDRGNNNDAGRRLVEGIERRNPLLGILNKLPGKDGRRWIVLPFSFNSGGVDFRVSLRILLADTNTLPWKAEYLAVDVTTDHRRWSFTLEEAQGASQGGVVFARALVGVYPPPERPAALEGVLRELLGTMAKEITLIEEV
ncbi:MAG: hypothetical protein LBP74_04150 [Treponema sp.]|jgi:hypothetical protein|nr:hypothetical protein [Treponema sp.]